MSLVVGSWSCLLQWVCLHVLPYACLSCASPLFLFVIFSKKIIATHAFCCVSLIPPLGAVIRCNNWFFGKLSLHMQCDRWPSTTNNQIFYHLSWLEIWMSWASSQIDLICPHIYLVIKISLDFFIRNILN